MISDWRPPLYSLSLSFSLSFLFHSIERKPTFCFVSYLSIHQSCNTVYHLCTYFYICRHCVIVDSCTFLLLNFSFFIPLLLQSSSSSSFLLYNPWLYCQPKLFTGQIIINHSAYFNPTKFNFNKVLLSLTFLITYS